MISYDPTIGDLVEYHGSLRDHHGRYIVVGVSFPPSTLRPTYVLEVVDGANAYDRQPFDGRLSNARRESITLLVANYQLEEPK